MSVSDSFDERRLEFAMLEGKRAVNMRLNGWNDGKVKLGETQYCALHRCTSIMLNRFAPISCGMLLLLLPFLYVREFNTYLLLLAPLVCSPHSIFCYIYD